MTAAHHARMCALLTLSWLCSAGSIACPPCQVLEWSIHKDTLTLTGPPLGPDIISAVLVVEDPLASCSYDLDPEALSGDGSWTTTISFAGECGETLGGSLVYVDQGEGLEPAGELRID